MPRHSPLIGLACYGDDELLTKAEMASLFGCSERTVERMVKRGEIPKGTTLRGRRIWLSGRVKKWLRDLLTAAEYGCGR